MPGAPRHQTRDDRTPGRNHLPVEDETHQRSASISTNRSHSRNPFASSTPYEIAASRRVAHHDVFVVG